MTGTQPTPLESTAERKLRLSLRRGAQMAIKLWDENRAERVVALLGSSGFEDSEQRLDAMLMDQRLRWQNGLECRAELYITILKHTQSDISHHSVWRLIEHELQLSLYYVPHKKLDIQELTLRFPDFADEIRSFETAVSRTSPRPESTSKPSGSSDLTHTIQSNEEATDRFELTDRIQKTNICGLKSDLDPTFLENDGSFHQHTRSIDATTEELVPSEQQTSQLGTCHPFDQLPPSLIKTLEERMSPATFETGEFLIKQGEKGDGLFLLVDGAVTVESDDADENRLLAKVNGPAVLGEMALLTVEPRTADVIARTPVTASFLPVAVFEEQATRYPVIGRVLTQLFADRLGKRGHDALAGKRLDRFLIRNRLGRGGMAIVYRGTDTRNDADVALKMMSHRLVYDHRALRLFQSEAQIIEQFDHPNIVKTVGRFKAFRTMFIAMEFCEGVSLDEIVKADGPIQPERFRTIMAQLASALAYAHGLKIVHRDIKPSNIMVSADNVVKLMDFGLANPIDSIKNDGYLAGTPRYMAPEQAKALPITERADIFALGCTAYRVLTGQSIITGTTVTDAIEQHENWEMPDLTQFDDDIATFLERCLQVDEAKRDIKLENIIRDWSRKW